MILNYNGLKWLEPLYESIAAQQGADIAIYLVDNDSSDDSLKITRERHPHVRIIAIPHNLGFAMAYNLATPIAFDDGCDWVVWANNDILLMPDCVSQMVSAAQSDPGIGIVGPAGLEWEGERANRYMRSVHRASLEAMRARDPKPIPVDWVEGSFLMVGRDCFDSVGPIDPFYFFYWEEIDYCRSARRHGWKVVLAPAAVMRHYAGGTSQSNRGKARGGKNRFDHLQRRNRYLYMLTDPEKGFAINWWLAVAHFLERATRPRSKRLQNFPSELRAFLAAMGMSRIASAKWRRDREMKPAPRCAGLSEEVRAAVEARFGPVS